MLNFYIDNNPLHNGLKKTNINPVYKKADHFDKTNYKSRIILLISSKTAFI